MKKNVLICWT